MWHYPLQSLRAKPSLPALPGREGDRQVSRYLVGACSTSSTRHQYCFCSWWRSQLGTKDQRCHFVTFFVLQPLLWHIYPILYCSTGFHVRNMPSSSACFFRKKPPHFFSTTSKDADISGSLTFLEGLWIRSSVWDMVCRASCNLLNRKNWCSLLGGGGSTNRDNHTLVLFRLHEIQNIFFSGF